MSIGPTRPADKVAESARIAAETAEFLKRRKIEQIPSCTYGRPGVTHTMPSVNEDWNARQRRESAARKRSSAHMKGKKKNG